MKYSIGIQSFEDLRNSHYVYVDKTQLIYQLGSTGKYYFLSRPRRFGKSLLISTMEAYFSGKKELFKGLAIETLEQEWVSYPILHLDLNTESYADDETSLERRLNRSLLQWEGLYGTSEGETSLPLRFEGIVRRAYEKTGRQVVILVDEYDKPMLQAIGNDALQDKFRNTLKAFYSVLKTQDRYIKFAFLTGVTKFGHCSEMNNLEDISMLNQYVEICGISEKEMHIYFDESIKELAEANNMMYDETCAKLKEQYGGYHFEHDTDGMYNPASLLFTFDSLKFKNYWYETGTPSFLIKLLEPLNYNLNEIQEEQVSSNVLNGLDSMSMNPVTAFYKSGYLTITGYDKRFKLYSLDFPNKDVEESFFRCLLPRLTTAFSSHTRGIAEWKIKNQ